MQKITVLLAKPASALDCTVDEPISWKDRARNTSPKPSMSLSNSGRTASGVESRPEKPVPPVTSTASTPGSAIQAESTALIW